MSEIKVNKISPATSTDITLGDSGDTFTVPSGATIVNSGTATGFGGGGKIGQVVTVQNIDVESQASSTCSTYYTIADLTCSITPTATDSKILVLSSLAVGVASTHIHYKLMRDSTDISVGTSAGSRESVTWNYHREDAASAYMCPPRTWTWLDSPSTTSAVDYSWKWSCHGGETMYLNRSLNDSDGGNYPRTASSITCMEVLA